MRYPKPLRNYELGYKFEPSFHHSNNSFLNFHIMNEKLKPAVQPKKKEQESRVPWLFDLEVKDLTSPITIRRIRLLQIGGLLAVIGLAGYFVWDNFLRAPSGVELVNEMVEAAGGMEAWNGIQSGQFTRTRNLYDETGSLLSQKTETFFFQKTDQGHKLMVESTDKDGKEVRIAEDDEGFWATKDNLPTDPKKASGDLGMMCDSKFCTPTCAASMAFFRFSMPFKLTDYGVRPKVSDGAVFAILDWNPLEFLQLQLEPLILDISYIPEVGKDKWRFMVDPNDKLIHKVEYYNKSDFGEIRPEEIYWSDHRVVDGFTVSHRWTSFWGNGKVMEEYVFSDMNFNNPIPGDFFNRPENLFGSVE